MKRSLEDYFFGTHSLKEFRIMINHYREYCENSNDSLLRNYKKWHENILYGEKSSLT